MPGETWKGRPTREDQSRNGVRVIVWRHEGGTTVDAACACFGLDGRAHSTEACPVFRRQREVAKREVRRAR